MNPQIKTILYATDMGEHMRPVFRYALEIAQKHRAKITVLHVIEPLNSGILFTMDVYMPKTNAKEMVKDGMKKALDKMKQRLDKFCEDEQVENPSECEYISNVKVVSGKPAESIIRQADKISADLIVVGSNTDQSMGSNLLGSTARKVTQMSNRAVLVVPVQ